MIEVIVAVDPRPNTKARHFVSVAQALGRGLIRPCCHARKRDRFSAHRKYQQILDRLDLLRHVAPPFTHFFPRRAKLECPGRRDRPGLCLEAERERWHSHHASIIYDGMVTDSQISEPADELKGIVAILLKS